MRDAERMLAEHASPRHGERYDVIIIGGGHNGLAAAAYLAKAGRSSLVLERREQLGGAAVSERAFSGFDARLSRYAYLISLLPERIIVELGLELQLARRAVASYTPDPRADGQLGLLVDGSDAQSTVGSFRELTGSEAEYRAWQALYSMTRRVARAVFPTLSEPLLSREQLRARLADDAAWEAVFETPLGELISSSLRDDLVAGVVLTDALIGTFTSADDEELRQNRCFLYHVIGRGTGDWLVPVGGMGALSSGLAYAARSAGADLRTQAEVLRLDPGAREVNVSFTDGTHERAASAAHVLVNAAPAELERLLGRTENRQPAPEGSQLKINLLLSRLPRLRDPLLAPERAFAGTFHINESAEQLQRAYLQAAAGVMPSTPPCECYCHTLTDASILSDGLRNARVHTLTVFGLHMPARLFAADPDGARAAALQATFDSIDGLLAEPLADCLLADEAGRPCIDVRTPLDLEAELRMPGGHIFHRDLAWPFAEREEEVGTWGVETAHPRILLCGAGARRGGGVSCVPGRNAAMAVLAASV